MSIFVQCDCGKRLAVRAELAGGRGKCPACGRVLVIPCPESAAIAGPAEEPDLDGLLQAEMARPAAPLAPLARRKKRRGLNPWFLAGLGTGAVALVAIVLGMLLSSSDDGDQGQRLAPSDAARVAQQPSSPAVPAVARRGTLPSLPDAVAEPPAWLVASAPFDVAAFFAAVPPDQNAAPLYFDAFYEFLGDMEVCFPPEEQSRRSPAVRQRESRFAAIYASWEKDPQSVDPAAIDAVLAEFQGGFEKLSRAQQRPRCVFQTGLSPAALMPHAQAARAVCQALIMRSHRCLASGDVDGATGNADAMLRLSRDFRPRSSAVPLLVGTAVEQSAATKVIPAILGSRRLTALQCDRLISLLTRHDGAGDPYLGSLQGEYIFVRTFFHHLENRTGPFASGSVDMHQALDRIYGTGWTNNFLRLPPSYVGLQIAAVDEWYRAMAGLAEADLHERAETVPRVVQGYTEKRLILAQMLPAYDAIVHAVARTVAIRRATLCLVALRRWQLDKSTPPPALETVCLAAGVANVPKDPYADGPLRMATIGGRPVVYALGPDRHDDGGRLEWDLDTENPRGDLVFRLPEVK